MDFGQIDAADPESELRVMMACGRVKLTIADSVIWDIDVPKSTAIIDDVDVWQQLLTDLDPPEVPSERGESRSPFGL